METKELTNKIVSEILDNFDKLLIQGLNLKGYTFINDDDLHQFLKDNVICEDTPHLQERIFLVKGIPFFYHSYKIDFPTFDISEQHKVTANYGYYKFL